MIRLASATISSVRLFSRLEGLSANGRVDPGAKITALQPFPTGLISTRYPLYSITVIAWAISIRHGHSPNHWLLRAQRTLLVASDAHNNMFQNEKGDFSRPECFGMV